MGVERQVIRRIQRFNQSLSSSCTGTIDSLSRKTLRTTSRRATLGQSKFSTAKPGYSACEGRFSGTGKTKPSGSSRGWDVLRRNVRTDGRCPKRERVSRADFRSAGNTPPLSSSPANLSGPSSSKDRYESWLSAASTPSSLSSQLTLSSVPSSLSTQVNSACSSIINVSLNSTPSIESTPAPIGEGLSSLCKDTDLLNMLGSLGMDPQENVVKSERVSKSEQCTLDDFSALMSTLNTLGLDKTTEVKPTQPKSPVGSRRQRCPSKDLAGCSPRTYSALKDTQNILNDWIVKPNEWLAKPELAGTPNCRVSL